MPGTDPLAAVAVVAGEFPELPHLVELPSRGAVRDLAASLTEGIAQHVAERAEGH